LVVPVIEAEDQPHRPSEAADARDEASARLSLESMRLAWPALSTKHDSNARPDHNHRPMSQTEFFNDQFTIIRAPS
jgi:hypothetical protein